MPSYLPPDPLSGLGLPRQRRSRRRQDELRPEEEQSIIGSLGRGALGALATVGNALDTPGAVVRNTINALGGGKANPLAPLFHPLSGEGRVSGRDLLTSAGMKPNNPNKWEFGDFAGFGTEVLLDPATYTTFGASALTKSGRAAKDAGKLTKGLKSGIQAGERGLMNVGIPFGPKATLGTGPTAQKIAGGLEHVGDRLAYGNIPLTKYSPGRHWQSLMSAPAMGAKTEIGIKAARKLYEEQTKALQGVRGKTVNWAHRLEKEGLKDAGAAFRSEGERLGGPLHDPTGVVGEAKQALNESQLANEALGIGVGRLKDSRIEYLPRSTNMPKSKRKYREPEINAPAMGTQDRTAKHRKEFLREFTEGTKGVNDLVTDPGIKAVIDAAKSKKFTPKQVTDAVEQHITAKYGDKIRRFYEKVDKQGNPILKDGVQDVANQHRELARWLQKLPDDVRTKGYFTNHPVVDIHKRLEKNALKQTTVQSVHETVRKVAKPKVAGESVSVGQVFQRLGIRSEDKALKKLRVPEEIASDLVRLHPKFQVPAPVGMLGKAADSFTNLFKAGVLTHPARYTRDVVSGQVRNIEQGWLRNPLKLKEAHDLYNGKPLKDAAEIPAVKQILDDMERQSGKPIDRSPQAATDVLRQLYAKFGSGGINQSTEVAGAAPDLSGGLDNILQAIPGRHPSSIAQNVKSVAKTAAGRDEGGSLNPFKIRGVGKQTDTAFGPVKAGEKVGDYTDTLNRMVPFLDMLRKGIEPDEAFRRINAAQVDYSPRSFTPFESTVMKRALPFYSFTSRQLPFVAGELAQKPGGAMAQTIRATNDAKTDDRLLPDYVANNATIPLGQAQDGTKRFVTGLGLMHEDPLGLIGSALQIPSKGVVNAARDVAAKSNPIIKGAAEQIFGKSLFQRGADGPRALEDLDPTIGRTLANITGRDKPVRFPGSTTLEALVGNSPLARVASTTRTLSDPRKGPLAKAANTLTGLRVTDVSPGSQDAVIREALQKAQKDMGAKSFAKVFVPEEDLRAMSPEDRAKAEQLMALSAVLAGRAKKRKELKKKAER